MSSLVNHEIASSFPRSLIPLPIIRTIGEIVDWEVADLIKTPEIQDLKELQYFSQLCDQPWDREFDCTFLLDIILNELDLEYRSPFLLKTVMAIGEIVDWEVADLIKEL